MVVKSESAKGAKGAIQTMKNNACVRLTQKTAKALCLRTHNIEFLKLYYHYIRHDLSLHSNL